MTESKGQLRSIVQRVENLHEQRKSLADDISDIYAEAKGAAFDVKAIKAVVARRAKDPSQLSEFEAIVETYEAALTDSDQSGTRARADAREAA